MGSVVGAVHHHSGNNESSVGIEGKQTTNISFGSCVCVQEISVALITYGLKL